MVKSKIKIYHLITSINLGGAENVAINLVENSPDNFEFVIIELFNTKSSYALSLREDLKNKNIRFKTLFKGSKRLSLLVAPIKLFLLLLKEKPAIIHSHTDLPDFVLASTLKLRKLIGLKQIKIVRTIHNTQLWSTHNRIGKFTESTFIDDCIVGVSEASLEAYIQLRKKYKLPISINKNVIYNGCKIPSKGISDFKIKKEKFNILFCGRFEYQKGIDILIERIKEINSRYKENFEFHIVGNGTYYNEIVSLSKEQNNIQLYNAIPNIANKMHVFDFMIMPSRFEGLVLTSIEASFSKVLVIAAKAPGLSETLPKDWPLNFNLKESSSLLTIFDNIVAKNYNLDEMKEEAFDYAEENFSFDIMLKGYNSIYLK
ncbi:glycosyltransferase family 4 protein [Lutibacter sp. A80]|uniref:glycosyltransferase family 4 protein n=1 Tax=Lutibacter sp. A80 TaxID=2918453 RepID=UPI001F06CBAA|nr:glycosyltransferase family 4 protein [Lutibacter sp. A80]UMB60799.1 glycosyltransferase family 4 protein [Lutibacter sp. A80]